MSEKINPGTRSVAPLPPREVMEWKSSCGEGRAALEGAPSPAGAAGWEPSVRIHQLPALSQPTEQGSRPPPGQEGPAQAPLSAAFAGAVCPPSPAM